jgi:hypothetical protein
VDYSNGVSLTDLTRNATGASTGFTWDFASGDDVTDTVVRSQTGRIVQNTLVDGAVTETSTYSFDAAGRLVTAVIPATPSPTRTPGAAPAAPTPPPAATATAPGSPM